MQASNPASVVWDIKVLLHELGEAGGAGAGVRNLPEATKKQLNDSLVRELCMH